MAVSFSLQGQIAVLEMNNPPVNALGRPLCIALRDAILQALKDDRVSAIVLMGKGAAFSSGADITEFSDPNVLRKPEISLPAVIEKYEQSNKPVIAAIHGNALGGGLELALGCHYRLATSTTKLGLPEVELGLLPGAGGTQRLPRLVGAEKALQMIVTGQPISATEAAKVGLVDSVIPNGADVLSFAVNFAKELLTNKQPDLATRRSSALTPKPVPQGFFQEARKRYAKERRGFEAPQRCIDAVELATTVNFATGMSKESDFIFNLMTSSQSKALRHLFFAQRTANKVPGVGNAKPVAVAKVAIVGAGTMGAGIAVTFLQRGVPVLLIDTTEKAVAAGQKYIFGTWEGAVKKGALSSAQVEKWKALLSTATTLESPALKHVDLAIEAVYENLALKQEIFAKLDQSTKPTTILATNTSTLDIDLIAGATKRPDRVIGMHFFAPANVMKLLENVRGKASSPETIVTAMDIGKKIGKVPVLVGNCDGFIGNRLYLLYAQEAYFLLEEGALPHEVDAALYDFGMAMGPFAVGDLSGLDVFWSIRKHKKLTDPANRPKGIRYSELADKLCERGRFGLKTGKGVYKYREGSRVPERDEEVEALVRELAQKSGRPQRRIDPKEIVERCIYALVNEGYRALSEGICARTSDIDVIFAFGYGFPRFRGGPMWYASEVGLGAVAARVAEFAKLYPDVPHWRPSALAQYAAKQTPKL